MTVGKSADIVNVRDSVVAEVVQRELQAKAIELEMFSNFSDMAGPGVKEIPVPRSSSFTANKLDLATPTAQTSQNLTFANDLIELNLIPIVNYTIPGYIELEAKPSYELTAARYAASAIGRDASVDAIDELWVGADDSDDVDFDATAAPSEIQEKILEMIEAADNAEMLDDGQRTLMIRPDLRRLMLQVPDFVRADQRGTVDSPLVNGQLGTIYNVRVKVTTHVGATAASTGGTFGDGKMMLVHPESLGYAFQATLEHDMEKAVEFGPGSMTHSWAQKWGVKALQAGALIIRGWNIP